MTSITIPRSVLEQLVAALGRSMKYEDADYASLAAGRAALASAAPVVKQSLTTQSQAERIAQLEDRITELTSEEHSIPELRQMLDDSYAEKQKCYFAVSQYQTANTNLLAERDTLRAALASAEPAKLCLWECGECGSQEYTMAASQEDVNELGCSGCGSSKWTKMEARK